MLKLLQFLAALFVVAVPVTYSHGQAYWSGYLTGLGLSEGMFELSFETTVLHGFMAQFVAIAAPLFISVLITSLAAFVAHNIHELTKVPSFRKLFFRDPAVWRASGNRDTGHPVTWRLASFLTTGTLIAAALLVTAFGMAISLDRFYERGESVAAKRIENPRPTKIIVLVNGEKLSGDLLECDTEFCALSAKGETIALPTSQLARIISPRTSLANQSAPPDSGARD